MHLAFFQQTHDVTVVPFLQSLRNRALRLFRVHFRSGPLQDERKKNCRRIQRQLFPFGLLCPFLEEVGQSVSNFFPKCPRGKSEKIPSPIRDRLYRLSNRAGNLFLCLLRLVPFGRALLFGVLEGRRSKVRLVRVTAALQGVWHRTVFDVRGVDFLFLFFWLFFLLIFFLLCFLLHLFLTLVCAARVAFVVALLAACVCWRVSLILTLALALFSGTLV